MGKSAASSGSYLEMFPDNLLVPSLSGLIPLKMGPPEVVPKRRQVIITAGCVITQESVVLNRFAAEACNRS